MASLIRYEPEPTTGQSLEKACEAIDDSDLVLVFVSTRALDRIAGKDGPYVRSPRMTSDDL